MPYYDRFGHQQFCVDCGSDGRYGDGPDDFSLNSAPDHRPRCRACAKICLKAQSEASEAKDKRLAAMPRNEAVAIVLEDIACNAPEWPEDERRPDAERYVDALRGELCKT